MAESSHAPCELLYILRVGWSFHIGNGGDLIGIGFDTMGADDVAQEYVGWNLKDAF